MDDSAILEALSPSRRGSAPIEYLKSIAAESSKISRDARFTLQDRQASVSDLSNEKCLQILAKTTMLNLGRSVREDEKAESDEDDKDLWNVKKPTKPRERRRMSTGHMFDDSDSNDDEKEEEKRKSKHRSLNRPKQKSFEKGEGHRSRTSKSGSKSLATSIDNSIDIDGGAANSNEKKRSKSKSRKMKKDEDSPRKTRSTSRDRKVPAAGRRQSSSRRKSLASIARHTEKGSKSCLTSEKGSKSSLLSDKSSKSSLTEDEDKQHKAAMRRMRRSKTTDGLAVQKKRIRKTKSIDDIKGAAAGEEKFNWEEFEAAETNKQKEKAQRVRSASSRRRLREKIDPNAASQRRSSRRPSSLSTSANDLTTITTEATAPTSQRSKTAKRRSTMNNTTTSSAPSRSKNRGCRTSSAVGGHQLHQALQREQSQRSLTIMDSDDKDKEQPGRNNLLKSDSTEDTETMDTDASEQAAISTRLPSAYQPPGANNSKRTESLANSDPSLKIVPPVGKPTTSDRLSSSSHHRQPFSFPTPLSSSSYHSRTSSTGVLPSATQKLPSAGQVNRRPSFGELSSASDHESKSAWNRLSNPVATDAWPSSSYHGPRRDSSDSSSKPKDDVLSSSSHGPQSKVSPHTKDPLSSSYHGPQRKTAKQEQDMLSASCHGPQRRTLQQKKDILSSSLHGAQPNGRNDELSSSSTHSTGQRKPWFSFTRAESFSFRRQESSKECSASSNHGPSKRSTSPSHQAAMQQRDMMNSSASGGFVLPMVKAEKGKAARKNNSPKSTKGLRGTSLYMNGQFSDLYDSDPSDDDFAY